MKIELTDEQAEMMVDLIRDEFDDFDASQTSRKWSMDFDYACGLWEIMSKVAPAMAREMYHDIELEYGKPPKQQ